MPTRRRTLRLIELAALFAVLPWWYSGWPVRAFGIWPPILAGFAGCLLYLLLDPTFPRHQLWNAAGTKRGLRWMLIRFAVGAALLTAATAIFEPDLFLAFPRANTAMWIVVMCFYPIFSVYPQEIIFRTFFTQRYAAALGSNAALVIVGAAAFGWAHVIFGTTLAVLLSALGGVLFMTTYLRTKSTLAASIEHALYGDLLFTVGLGWYFYSGSIDAAV